MQGCGGYQHAGTWLLLSPQRGICLRPRGTSLVLPGSLCRRGARLSSFFGIWWNARVPALPAHPLSRRAHRQGYERVEIRMVSGLKTPHQSKLSINKGRGTRVSPFGQITTWISINLPMHA